MSIMDIGLFIHGFPLWQLAVYDVFFLIVDGDEIFLYITVVTVTNNNVPILNIKYAK